MDECIKIWNDSAILASKYRGSKNVYVCEFEKLVIDPQKESENILRFLNISSNKPFSPKKTSMIDLDQVMQQYILDATKAARMALYNKNYNDL